MEFKGKHKILKELQLNGGLMLQPIENYKPYDYNDGHSNLTFRLVGKTPSRYCSIVYADCFLRDDNTLWNFKVSKPFRGRGYGRILISMVISYIKINFPTEKVIYLYCETDNIDGLAFWEEMGWHKESEEIHEIFFKNVYRLMYEL